MRVRASLLRLHLPVGVLTGGALLVLALRGIVLVLQPELDHALHPADVSAASNAPSVSLEALVDAARRGHPGYRVTRLSLPGGADAAAWVGRRRLA